MTPEQLAAHLTARIRDRELDALTVDARLLIRRSMWQRNALGEFTTRVWDGEHGVTLTFTGGMPESNLIRIMFLNHKRHASNSTKRGH